MFKKIAKTINPVSFSLAVILSMSLSVSTAAYDGIDNNDSPFKVTTENGVKVWRAQAPKRIKRITPALLGDEDINIVSEVNIEKEVLIKPRSRPAKVRVIGHFSGYGKRIPFVQGFYSGYPRSKTSRSYRQGFYSGYRTNKKRRFPLERPNGFRKLQ